MALEQRNEMMATQIDGLHQDMGAMRNEINNLQIDADRKQVKQLIDCEYLP